MNMCASTAGLLGIYVKHGTPQYSLDGGEPADRGIEPALRDLEAGGSSLAPSRQSRIAPGRAAFLGRLLQSSQAGIGPTFSSTEERPTLLHRFLLIASGLTIWIGCPSLKALI